MSPATASPRRFLTHAISSFQPLNVLSLPSLRLSSRLRFSVESGCKDTTFFRSAKIFFREKTGMKHKHRAPQCDTDETFFQIRAKHRGKTCANTKNSTQNTQISGSRHSAETEYRCILLYFNNINHLSIRHKNILSTNIQQIITILTRQLINAGMQILIQHYYHCSISPIKNRRHLSIRDAGYSKFFLIL